MEYFVERGPTDQEVHQTIRRKYGDRARVLARKEIRTGGVLGLFQRQGVEVTGYWSSAPISPPNRGSNQEERRKILEAALAGTRSGVPAAPGKTVVSTGSAPVTTASDGGFADRVLAEIQSLRRQVGVPDDMPGAVRAIESLLRENDFAADYIAWIVDRLKGECSLADLEDEQRAKRRVAQWIADSIRVHPWTDRGAGPRVVVLVGPTGVGKTTTIAKLAAMYGAVADPSYDVRMLTIDSYRIGALYQIEKYGEIMNIPVHAVETAADMNKHLALSADADYVFVDTTGKSPHDFGKLAEVNELVREAGGEVHLTVSAGTKTTDVRDILRVFEPFNYRSVILTKLDETTTVGGLISALHEKQKSISFVTDGQSVPQDIEIATPEVLTRRLHGFPPRRPVVVPAQEPDGGER